MRTTQVNDVVLVDDTVVVDVLVDGITRGNDCRTVPHHDGLALDVLHDVAFRIAGIGCLLVLVDAQVTVAVEGALRTADLVADGVVAVVERIFLVGLVDGEFGNLVHVAADVEIAGHAPILVLVRREVGAELPTFVGHLAGVVILQLVFTVTGCRRYLHILLQQVTGVTLVHIERETESVTQQRDVQTGVVLGRRLPFQAVELHGRRLDAAHVHVVVAGFERTDVDTRTTCRTSALTDAETELQLTQPVDVAHERFLGNVPGETTGREGSPTLGLTHRGVTLHVDRGVEHIAVQQGVVERQDTREGALFGVAGGQLLHRAAHDGVGQVGRGVTIGHAVVGCLPAVRRTEDGVGNNLVLVGPVLDVHQLVLRVDGEQVGRRIRTQVRVAVGPGKARGGLREELAILLVTDVEADVCLVGQLRQNLVLHVEVHLALALQRVVLAVVGKGNRVVVPRIIGLVQLRGSRIDDGTLGVVAGEVLVGAQARLGVYIIR